MSAKKNVLLFYNASTTMKRLQLIILYMYMGCGLACLQAQSADKAQKLFFDQQYEEAHDQYHALLRRSPKSALYNYRYARCCYELGDDSTAIRYFEAAGERYPLRDFYLGELYFNAYEFDRAIEAYRRYLPSLEEDDERIPTLHKKIAQAEMAARFLARVEDIAVVDSMVVPKDDFLTYYRIASELGTLQQERIALTDTTQADHVRYTTQRQDRTYFSDSIGGYLKLFTSYRLLDGWSRPTLLPETVNASGNVNYPFLMPDGVTLYFASDGVGSMGGYDIFITKYMPATDQYLMPENVGMPFNSPYNDYMMLVDEANGIGWFATDRYQAEGQVAIYLFVPNEATRVLRDADPAYIRRAARLLTYREAELHGGTVSSSKSRRSTTEADDAFEFIITDRIVYTRADQFRSSEARQAWQQLNDLKKKQESMKAELASLRQAYAQASDETGQATIAPKILDLERRLQEQDAHLHDLAQQARNAEIKVLGE